MSLATASRALDPTTTHPISQSTRLRVREVADTLGYQPNPMARGLRMQRLWTLAVLVNDISDPYFVEIVRASSTVALESGLLTIVCCSGRSPELELKNLAMLRQARVAAVLFAGGSMADAEHERRVGALAGEIRSYGGAVVALAPRAERWPAEVADNRAGAAMAARHVLDLGHRHVGVITGPSYVRSSIERESGYREELSAAGVEWNRAEGDFSPDGGQRATAELLARGRPVSAILVANDAMAMGVLAEARRQGIPVPGGLSVVGFGDIPQVRYFSPALTTIRVPAAEMARAAVRRVLDMLEGHDSELRVRVHPVELVVRDSTGPPTLVGAAAKISAAERPRRGQPAIAPR